MSQFLIIIIRNMAYFCFLIAINYTLIKIGAKQKQQCMVKLSESDINVN